MRLLATRRSGFKGFLFFLGLTTCMAIISKLSKQYTTSLQIPVSITQVETNKVIEHVSPTQLNLNMSMSGFSLLRNAFHKPDLEIPFSQLQPTNDSLNYELKVIDKPAVLETAVKGNFTINPSSSSEIQVKVGIYDQKYVAVKPQIEFDFVQGFNKSRPLIIEPDSVLISGSALQLKEIEFIPTTYTKYAKVDASVEKKVRLDTTGLAILVENNSFEISVKQEVSKFTEGQFNIPIKILNDPKKSLKIFPKNVDVFFNASLTNFSNIKSEDFEVFCDFSAYKEGDSFLPLELKRKLDHVSSARLGTKQVRFIIIDK